MKSKNRKYFTFVCLQHRTVACIKQYVVTCIDIPILASRESVNWNGYIDIKYLKSEICNWGFNVSGLGKTNIEICMYYS
jgi:hypothetical protein